VTLNADGSFSYDPTSAPALQAIPRGGSLQDSFTYRINDGQGAFSNTATVKITVTGALNHPPVANPDFYNGNNSSVLTVPVLTGVLVNDTDADNDPLTVDRLNNSATLTGTSAMGAAVTLNADGSFSYDPTGSKALQALPRDTTTPDTFSYRANDANGGTATATVTIMVKGVVNHPPVANNDTGAVNNNATLTGSSVLANDTDADNDPLTVDQVNGSGGTFPLTVTLPSGATLKMNSDGTYFYDPTTSTSLQAIPRTKTAPDSFTYEANDGHGGTSTATVNITVTGVINHPPVANPDTYSANNNAVLTVTPASSGVLANDTDLDNDPLTVDKLQGGSALTGTSAKGAAVTINPDGTFTYDATGAAALHPPQLAIGNSTPDTFTYEVSDGQGGLATGTVTVNVTAVDTPPTANNFTVATNVVGNTLIEVGTQPAPSSEPKTTDATNMAAHASDPDIPFGDSLTFSAAATSLHNGVVSVTNPSTGAFTYRPVPGFTGTDSFTYTATDSYGKTSSATVTLTVSGRVWYVKNNATAPGDGSSGSPLTTLASAESASGSSVNDFIYVFKGDGTSNNQNAGITLKNGQTLLGENYPLKVGSQQLFAGTTGNRPAIGNVGGAGVTLASGDTVQGFDITSTGGGNFAIAGGAPAAAGTISDNILHGTTGAGGLRLNGTTGAWSISGLDATGSGAAAFDASAAGTVAFTGNNTLTGAGATAFKNAGATSYSGTINNVTSSSGAANGVDLSGTLGTLTLNNTNLSGTTGNSILASGGAANVTISGTETNGAGDSVNVTGRTGGTITIATPINDSGTGINVVNNTGATIKFTGAIVANTGAKTAFNVTGGGTVSASDLTSTLTTSSGSDLNFTNTTIGAAGLHFQSITNGSGAPRAISLVNTGTSGGLAVSGTGTTAGSGGTIRNTSSTGTAAVGSGDGGIYLNNTSNVSLAHMIVQTNHASGIYGTAVNGFTLTGSSVTGNGTSQPANDSGIRIDGLTGTATIGTTGVSGSRADNARIRTGTTGSLTLTVTGSSFGPQTASVAGGDGLMVIEDGGSLNLTATGDTFTGNYSDGLGVIGNGNGAMTVVAKNNAVTNNTGTGINAAAGANVFPDAGFTISGNTFNAQQGNAINVVNLGGGTWHGHVASNTVGNPTTANSGSTAGAGINVVQEGSGTLTAQVDSNTVDQVKQSYGIQASAENGSGHLNVNVTNNTVNQQPATSLDGITVGSGAVPGDSDTVCLNATGNKSTATATGASNGTGFDAVGMSVVQQAGTFNIQGNTGASPTVTDVQNLLIANNTLSGPSNPADKAFAQGTFPSFGGTCAAALAGPARDLAGRTIVPATAAHAGKHAATRSAKRGSSHRARSHRRSRAAAPVRSKAAARAQGIARLRARLRNATQWLPAWLRRRR
jgi:hypothetical protein